MQTPIDFITIAQVLRDRNNIEAIGGSGLHHVAFHLSAHRGERVLLPRHPPGKARPREIIRVCTEFAARSYDEQDKCAMLLDKVEQEDFRDRQGPLQGQGGQHQRDGHEGHRRHPTSSTNAAGRITGLETGFKVFDQMTDGLHGAEMIVIAARPSMGKTAFAMNIAEHIAVKLGMPVAVFSLEMSSQQLVQRVLCSLARVNLGNIRNGFLSERDFPAITAAAASSRPPRCSSTTPAALAFSNSAPRRAG